MAQRLVSKNIFLSNEQRCSNICNIKKRSWHSVVRYSVGGKECAIHFAYPLTKLIRREATNNIARRT